MKPNPPLKPHALHKVADNSREAHETTAELREKRENQVLAALQELGTAADHEVQAHLGGDVIGWRVQPKLSVLLNNGLIRAIESKTNPGTGQQVRITRLATAEETEQFLKDKWGTLLDFNACTKKLTKLEQALTEEVYDWLRLRPGRSFLSTAGVLLSASEAGVEVKFHPNDPDLSYQVYALLEALHDFPAETETALRELRTHSIK